MSSGEEKTEKPTPKKVKENRKEGKVPRTQELGSWGALLVVALLLSWLVGNGTDRIRELMLRSLALVEDPDPAKVLALLREGTVTGLLIALALGFGVMVVSVAGGAAQGGIFFATKSLKPKWSKLNPIQGAKRIFGAQAWWEGAKLLLKSSVVGLLVWRAVQELMPLLGGLVPMHVALDMAAATATGLMRDVAVAGLVAAAADYAFQRRKMGKQTRMTKKEIRDEHKMTEGDPLVKSAIRSRQLAAARNRMMADIPQADVVLVNPVHVAVALRYESSRGTPRVVAKGAGAVAARIRAVADENRVPMVEDVPLARALHASCEVGQEIPPELYHAVAQVLAFVLSRKAKGVAAGRHRSPRTDGSLPAVDPRERRAARRRATPTP
ncbi:MAG TPA: EscU/YscU/HrcU family type III secretion system export apparatus switch protein [Nocardioidaceae bacterium]|nr:EscU/YscU/HrcU family type III secretion system export apparatus switch protein [Nocardioidaceae bacterium]